MIGFVIPLVIISFGVAPLIILAGDGKGWARTALLATWVLLAIAGPLVAGYIGARLAAAAPVVHGLAAGLISLAVAVMVPMYKGMMAALMTAAGLGAVTGLGIAIPITVAKFLLLSLCGAVIAKRTGDA
ncbi:MAG: hypothetical protein R3E65_01060 [Steroidobacteraceae bacterium]